MSRIFDALKSAQATRAKTSVQGGNILGLLEPQDRRESPRVEINVELTVYGRTPGGPPFYDKAQAVRGNKNGGLILMTVPVIEGQDLLLINNQISMEQVCRVLEFRARDEQVCEVSVLFSTPSDDFWGIPATVK